MLGSENKYKLIDPKGVIGDPVFDISRFVLNEFEEEINSELYVKINHIICELERILKISNNILKQCLYIETIMAMCWYVEDGSTPEEYVNHIKTAIFVDNLLNYT